MMAGLGNIFKSMGATKTMGDILGSVAYGYSGSGLKTPDTYSITSDSGKDYSGYDILSGQQYKYFYDKYGDKDYKNRGGYIMNDHYYYNSNDGESSSYTTDPMSLLQDRLPTTGSSDPFTNIITNYNLSDLYYGDKWRQDEINAYKQSRDNLSQYVTGTNEDGTVNLYIPKGSSGWSDMPNLGSSPEGLSVKNIRLYDNDKDITNYLNKGGGFLGRYKESMLNTAPDSFKLNQYALGGFDWAGETQKELDYNKQYGQKILDIADQQAAYDQQLADYEKKKNAGRSMYKQGGAGGGGNMPIGRGLGASDSSQLILNKYSLLG